MQGDADPMVGGSPDTRRRGGQRWRAPPILAALFAVTFNGNAGRRCRARTPRHMRALHRAGYPHRLRLLRLLGPGLEHGALAQSIYRAPPCCRPLRQATTARWGRDYRRGRGVATVRGVRPGARRAKGARSIAYPLSRVTSGGGAASLLAVAGRSACTDVRLLDPCSRLWTPPSPPCDKLSGITSPI